MTPPKLDHPGWNAVAKVALSIIGAMLVIVVGWAARAAERQSEALEELKKAVYSGQKDDAVLEKRVETVESGLAETKDRVRVIESKLMKEK